MVSWDDMKAKRESHDVAPRRRIAVILTLAALAVAGTGGWWWFGVRRGPVPLRIATGGKGGTYHALGTGLGEVLSSEIPGARAQVLETAGSLENLRLLERGEADLAFVQNDTPGSQSIRTIAPLYEEVLHIVVRAETPPIDDILDLRGRSVSVGPAGGGTEVIVDRLFLHFGIGPGEVDEKHLTTQAAVEAFERGELDAVCIIAGLKSPAAERLLHGGKARLLSLGSVDRAGSAVDGLQVTYPYVSRTVIPVRTYGAQPAEAVATIAVKAVLVANRSLDDELAKEIARLIFENKVKIAEHHPIAARFSERMEAAELRFPYHDGAVAYYTRSEPPFFVTYAESINLGLTIAVGLGSAFLAAREWVRRRKKNRIDVYYLEIDDVSRRVPTAPPAELLEMRRTLQGLRRRAFEELVAEHLEADESFTIFQDFLRAELLEIDGRLRTLDADAAATAAGDPASSAKGG